MAALLSLILLAGLRLLPSSFTFPTLAVLNPQMALLIIFGTLLVILIGLYYYITIIPIAHGVVNINKGDTAEAPVRAGASQRPRAS